MATPLVASQSETLLAPLVQGAERLGLHLDCRQLDAFGAYLRELLDWNQRFNLTAVNEPSEVVTKHFLDSLTGVLGIPAPRDTPRRVVDIGSGAGFPGVPLKLAAPQLQITLVDSLGKRTRFLKHLASQLGLTDVSVVTARAEALAALPPHREAYDIVLARAVAPMPVLVELTLPFLRVGGRLIAWKKGDVSQEIEDADNAIKVLGGAPPAMVAVPADVLPDQRCLVLVDKVSPTPNGYPRRPGMPAKRPL